MITLTEQSVREAAERYRGSTQLNPYNSETGVCSNLIDGQHCLAAQILFDLGVTDEQLATLPDEGISPVSGLPNDDDDLTDLVEREIIAPVGVAVRDLLAGLQKAADTGGSGSFENKRLPWGKAIARVLG